MNVEPKIYMYKLPVTKEVEVTGLLEEWYWYSARFFLNAHFQEALMLAWSAEAEKLRKKNDSH